MNIIDLLSSILNPSPGQNRLVAPNANGPNYLTQTGLGPEQLARFHQMSGIGGQAAPPQSVAPQQAQMPDQQQTASTAAPAPQGGGILSRLFGGGQNDGANQTIQWLQQQGMDQGTATMMANSKPALQEYLLKRAQGPAAQTRHTTTIDGKLVDTDTGQVVGDYSKPADKVRMMSPDEVKAAGLEPGAYQQKPDGSIVPIGGTSSKPSSVQEYEYAKKQGFPGTLADWEASKKGGMSLQVDPNTGEVSFQQGSNIKPMTEAQSKDTNFAVRAKGALPAIEKYGTALTNPATNALAHVPLAGNYFKSDEYQQAEQAGNEFLTAILRKDSGAVIGAEELKTYGTTYLPQPGDGAPLLAQKQASRARALAGLEAGMTPQAILAQEKALRGGGVEESPSPARKAFDDAASPDGWKQVSPGVKIRKVN